jgi:hypothetical protein
MNNVVEAQPLLRVSEDQGSEPHPINGSGLTDNTSAKLPLDVMVGWLAGLHDDPGDFISVNNPTTQATEDGHDVSFAGGDAAGESHFQQASSLHHRQN